MPIAKADSDRDGVPIVRMESDRLRVEVAPTIGGRVVSLVEKASGHEFLWHNQSLRLELCEPGTEYDPHFYGGIDELLPNDVPEEINGVSCPDHGELWTTPLTWKSEGDELKLEGTLPRFGLDYARTMTLRENEPCLDLKWRISNKTEETRHFLWKLHAALKVQVGDVVECPARRGQVVDLNYSRFRSLAPFAWPEIEGVAANIVPPANGTVDFFYLFDLEAGRIALRKPKLGLEFGYEFDSRAFPCAWMFASYGGFLGHYTVILEPCTAMPISVNEACRSGRCSVLKPGEVLETVATLRAGPLPELSGGTES
jgi:hypothetical protein